MKTLNFISALTVATKEEIVKRFICFIFQLEGVEKSRSSLEQQAAEVAAAIEEKLKTAANQRDENIKKILDKLKEHVSAVCKFQLRPDAWKSLDKIHIVRHET